MTSDSRLTINDSRGGNSYRCEIENHCRELQATASSVGESQAAELDNSVAIHP